MKFWGAVVVLLYVLILVVLWGPLGGILFFSPDKVWQHLLDGMVSMYTGGDAKWAGVCLIVALISQAALLSVPVEITAKLARLRCRVYEVGISYSGRTYEEGKKITWRDGVRALWCIFKYNLLR